MKELFLWLFVSLCCFNDGVRSRPQKHSFANKTIPKWRSTTIPVIRSTPLVQTAKGYMMIRAFAQNYVQLSRIQSYEYNKRGLVLVIWKVPRHVGDYGEFFVAPSSYQALRSYFARWNINTNVIMQDSENAVELKNTTAKNVGNFDEKYHTYEQIISELKRLAFFHSKIAKLEDIGKSSEERSIYVLKISENESANKEVVFLSCGVHGREWLAIGSCIGIARQLVFYHRMDRQIRSLLGSFDVHIIPILNADGYSHSKLEERLWRKTRTPSSKSSCVGIDINRNFNHEWGSSGSSADPCSETYAGEHPFSANEALVLARYLYSVRDRVAAFLDIHTFGQIWMSPWGYTLRASRHRHLHELALDRIISAIEHETGIRYRSGPTSSILYRISGDSVDWVYGFLGVIHSYGVELRPSFSQSSGMEGFKMPADEIKPTIKELLTALSALRDFISGNKNLRM